MKINAFFEYKWKYIYSNFLKVFTTKPSRNNNYLYIVEAASRNWILGSKARRLQANSNLPGEVIYTKSFKFIPDAEGYFFLHQKYFARCVRYNPHLLKRKLIVMFTHPEWNKWYSANHMAYILNFAHKIICLNSAVMKELQEIGVPKNKLEMFHLVSDPNMFKPKIREGNGAIGFSMAFGPRKNPDMVVQLIKMLPDRKFIIVGPGWNDFLVSTGTLNLPNLTYFNDVNYEQYPEIYSKMDVLVSTSVLEGGPVPILEAMLCNVVPVASRTGFCIDIIKHGVNGFLFNIDATANEIIQLIDEAFLFRNNVRLGIEVHSWENYGNKISDLFKAI
jgi:glycosyltransferase involved in cell wall biosynthesis